MILPIILFGSCLVFLLSRQLSWTRKIPGPRIAQYTNLWYAWQILKSDFHWTNIRLHEEKGKIVQITPSYFSISDPDAAKIIYGHGSRLDKSEWYDGWTNGPKPNMFSERHHAQHANMRRVVAAMYSMSALVSYEPYVDDCIAILERRLDERSSEHTVIDLPHWLQCYAFDVIAHITFGERIGFLDKGEDIQHLIRNLDAMFTLSSLLGLFLWVRPLVLRLLGLIGGHEAGFIQRFNQQKIKEAQEDKSDVSENGPTNMVKKMIFAQRVPEGTKTITDLDIRMACGANIAAGSDTTSLTLTAVLFYLYRNPACLEKLRKEISDAGLDSTAQSSFRDLQNMPYLQAAIKEALRMHPGTGFPLWRQVPQGGLTICGQFFPEGSNIGCNSWVLHQNKGIYGEDADQYHPERWLSTSTEDNEKLKTMEQFFMPFGLGARNCIGKNVSLLEINKLIPVLVRDFDIDFVTQDGNSLETNILPGKNRWFVKTDGLYARLKRRN